MNKLKSALYLLEELIQKQEELKDMVTNWNTGDCYEQACSDPSTQYCLLQEIETLTEEFKQFVNNNF